MKEEIEKAVSYANSSNELEDNSLSINELDKIIEDIKNGKSDKSFIYSVVELVRKNEKEMAMEEEENVKVRK